MRSLALESRRFGARLGCSPPHHLVVTSTRTESMDQALLSHLLARMQADVDFLAAQSLLNQQDADLIRSKLPSVSAGPLHQQLGQLNLHGGAAAQSARVVLPPPASPAPAAPQPQNVRALWDYAATQVSLVFLYTYLQCLSAASLKLTPLDSSYMDRWEKPNADLSCAVTCNATAGRFGLLQG